jgi:hypothetical protein
VAVTLWLWSSSSGSSVKLAAFDEFECIIVFRSAMTKICRSQFLKHFAGLHYCDTAAHMRHNRQVMAYKDVSQSHLGTQIGKPVENFSLHRYVQRRSGLVEQDDFRPKDQGTCKRYSLSLLFPGCGDIVSLNALRRPMRLGGIWR